MWGRDPATKKIVINDRTFLVRQNLWDFLRRAQDEPPPYHGPLWIDAICIDQENILERGHQVALMGEIYSNTQLVISWLGASDEKYADGLDYASEIFGKNPPEVVLSKIDPDLPKLEQICTLFEHEYWTRAWIFQEVVLPKQAELWVGSRSVRHRAVYMIENWLHRVENDKYKQQILRILALGEWLHRAKPGRQVLRSVWEESNFAALLHVTASMKCQDVRDRVFAILSLLDPKERDELDIVPDYTVSPLELCRLIEGKMGRYHGIKWLFPIDPMSLYKALEVEPLGVAPS